jgi:hypothetical protein
MTNFREFACAGVICLLTTAGWAADTQAANQQTAVCTFQDGGQVTVRYEAAPVHGDQLPQGHAWNPGESPTYLFTSTALKAGETEIPVGAYSLYIIPEKHQWTLVVNKDVNDKKYDAQKDVARLPMDLGTLGEGNKNVDLAFGHVAPKQCNLRLYYGKTGAWAVFNEP